MEKRGYTCSISHRFIRIDALVEVFSVEKVLQQFLDLWDASGSSYQDDVVDLSLVHLCVTERLLDWLQGSSEQVSVQLLEAGPGDGGVEIDAFVERIDFDARLSAGGQGALGSLTGCTQTTHGPLVFTDVLLELAFELGDKVVDHTVVKIFSTQVCVTCCGFDLKDAIFNRQDGDVECSTTQVKDEDIPLCSNLYIMLII